MSKNVKDTLLRTDFKRGLLYLKNNTVKFHNILIANRFTFDIVEFTLEICCLGSKNINEGCRVRSTTWLK